MVQATTVYRSHRIMDVLRQQGRTNAWFCRQMPCDYSLLYRTRDGERRITDWFATRASEVLSLPVDALFIEAEDVDAA